MHVYREQKQERAQEVSILQFTALERYQSEKECVSHCDSQIFNGLIDNCLTHRQLLIADKKNALKM